MSGKWRYWAVAVAIVGSAVWGLSYVLGPYAPEPQELQRIVKWVAEQKLSGGTHELELPNELRGLSADKNIVVVRRSNGSFIVLVKTVLHGHHNYSGYVLTTEPLKDQDFGVESYNDVKTIEFEIPDMVDPMIHRQVDPTTFEVFYNLG